MKKRQSTPLEQMFWQRVKKTSTCWLWTGEQTLDGYGQFGKNRTGRKAVYAHRFSWELHHKKKLGKDEIHHNPTCKKVCVNPLHLHRVKRFENPDCPWYMNSQKTHCAHGHPLSGSNLYKRKRNGKITRECKICRSRAAKIWAFEKRSSS